MLCIAEALSLLADDDPACDDPMNRELAYKIWGAWSEVYKTLGAKAQWGIAQKETTDASVGCSYLLHSL
jgi:hypothetical protein